MFRGSFMKVSRDFQGLFQESFQGVSSNIDQCFEVDLKVFQGSFKGISSVFQECFVCFKEV